MKKLACLLIAVWVLGSAAGARQRPPNVLLITLDNLGYADTAITGHPLVRTPNIDRLAREGVFLSDVPS